MKELETHDKLIRGNIIKKLESKHIEHSYHMADAKEYKNKLYEKLTEESMEFTASNDPEELADLLEVIEAVKKLNGWSTQEIEEIRLKKLEKEGSFVEPYILEKCEKKA